MSERTPTGVLVERARSMATDVYQGTSEERLFTALADRLAELGVLWAAMEDGDSLVVGPNGGFQEALIVGRNARVKAKGAKADTPEAALAALAEQVKENP